MDSLHFRFWCVSVDPRIIPRYIGLASFNGVSLIGGHRPTDALCGSSSYLSCTQSLLDISAGGIRTERACATDVSISWASDLVLFHCRSKEGDKRQHVWARNGMIRRVKRGIRLSATTVAEPSNNGDVGVGGN